jgi:hypothetical protein
MCIILWKYGRTTRVTEFPDAVVCPRISWLLPADNNIQVINCAAFV